MIVMRFIAVVLNAMRITATTAARSKNLESAIRFKELGDIGSRGLVHIAHFLIDQADLGEHGITMDELKCDEGTYASLKTLHVDCSTSHVLVKNPPPGPNPPLVFIENDGDWKSPFLAKLDRVSFKLTCRTDAIIKYMAHKVKNSALDVFGAMAAYGGPAVCDLNALNLGNVIIHYEHYAFMYSNVNHFAMLFTPDENAVRETKHVAHGSNQTQHKSTEPVNWQGAFFSLNTATFYVNLQPLQYEPTDFDQKMKELISSVRHGHGMSKLLLALVRLVADIAASSLKRTLDSMAKAVADGTKKFAGGVSKFFKGPDSS